MSCRYMKGVPFSHDRYTKEVGPRASPFTACFAPNALLVFSLIGIISTLSVSRGYCHAGNKMAESRTVKRVITGNTEVRKMAFVISCLTDGFPTYKPKAFNI